MNIIKRENIASILAVVLWASSSFALVGDGGTIATCYPGGLHQVLASIKPFVVPCAQFTTIGTCGHVSKLVSYWLPIYAIEVTGNAGTTIFPDGSFGQSLSDMATNAGSMVQGEPGNDTQTKHREAHIYAFSVTDLSEMLSGHPAQTCMMSGSNNLLGRTIFRSEASTTWKTCKDTGGLAEALAQVGAWGQLFPRCGWTSHPSNVTAGLLYAYRAQDLASGSGLGVSSGHILIDRYEIGGPTPGMCYPIGTPSMSQEKFANRPGCSDRFVIIYWQFMVKCCIF